MLQKLIFDLIEERRLQREYTVEQLAYRAGISCSQYYNIKNGRNTSLGVIEKLLKATGITNLNIII